MILYRSSLPNYYHLVLVAGGWLWQKVGKSLHHILQFLNKIFFTRAVQYVCRNIYFSDRYSLLGEGVRISRGMTSKKGGTNNRSLYILKFITPKKKRRELQFNECLKSVNCYVPTKHDTLPTLSSFCG